MMYASLDSETARLAEELEELGGGDSALGHFEVHAVVEGREATKSDKHIDGGYTYDGAVREKEENAKTLWVHGKMIGIRDVHQMKSRPAGENMSYTNVTSSIPLPVLLQQSMDHSYDSPGEGEPSSFSPHAAADWVVDGFNACVLAYGPRQIGKSMALFGPPHNADAPHAGLAEGALRRLYERAGLPLQNRAPATTSYRSPHDILSSSGDSGAPSSPLRSKISARLQGQHQLKAAEKVRNASTIALSVWSVSGKRVVDLCASKSTTTHNNKMGPTSDTSPAPGVVPSEFAMVACPTLEAAMSVLATARKRATGSLTHPEGSSTADRGYFAEHNRAHLFVRVVLHQRYHPRPGQPSGSVVGQGHSAAGSSRAEGNVAGHTATTLQPGQELISHLHIVDLIGTAPAEGDPIFKQLTESGKIARRENASQLGALYKVLGEMKRTHARQLMYSKDAKNRTHDSPSRQPDPRSFPGAVITSTRDSILTQVLAPLMLGNCKTYLLAFLQDGEKHYRAAKGVLGLVDGLAGIARPVHRVSGVPRDALALRELASVLPPDLRDDFDFFSSQGISGIRNAAAASSSININTGASNNNNPANPASATGIHGVIGTGSGPHIHSPTADSGSETRSLNDSVAEFGEMDLLAVAGMHSNSNNPSSPSYSSASNSASASGHSSPSRPGTGTTKGASKSSSSGGSGGSNGSSPLRSTLQHQQTARMPISGSSSSPGSSGDRWDRGGDNYTRSGVISDLQGQFYSVLAGGVESGDSLPGAGKGAQSHQTDTTRPFSTQVYNKKDGGAHHRNKHVHNNTKNSNSVSRTRNSGDGFSYLQYLNPAPATAVSSSAHAVIGDTTAPASASSPRKARPPSIDAVAVNSQYSEVQTAWEKKTYGGDKETTPTVTFHEDTTSAASGDSDADTGGLSRVEVIAARADNAPKLQQMYARQGQGIGGRLAGSIAHNNVPLDVNPVGSQKGTISPAPSPKASPTNKNSKNSKNKASMFSPDRTRHHHKSSSPSNGNGNVSGNGNGNGSCQKQKRGNGDGNKTTGTALPSTSTSNSNSTTTSSGEEGPKSSPQIAPALVEKELERIYYIHNPEKVSTVHRILESWHGHEIELLEQVALKYGEHSPLLITHASSDKSSSNGNQEKLDQKLDHDNDNDDFPSSIDSQSDTSSVSNGNNGNNGGSGSRDRYSDVTGANTSILARMTAAGMTAAGMTPAAGTSGSKNPNAYPPTVNSDGDSSLSNHNTQQSITQSSTDRSSDSSHPSLLEIRTVGLEQDVSEISTTNALLSPLSARQQSDDLSRAHGVLVSPSHFHATTDRHSHSVGASVAGMDDLQIRTDGLTPYLATSSSFGLTGLRLSEAGGRALALAKEGQERLEGEGEGEGDGFGDSVFHGFNGGNDGYNPNLTQETNATNATYLTADTYGMSSIGAAGELDLLRRNTATLMEALSIERRQRVQLENKLRTSEEALIERETETDLQDQDARLEVMRLKSVVRSMEQELKGNVVGSAGGAGALEEIFAVYEKNVARLENECSDLRERNLLLEAQEVDRLSENNSASRDMMAAPALHQESEEQEAHRSVFDAAMRGSMDAANAVNRQVFEAANRGKSASGKIRKLAQENSDLHAELQEYRRLERTYVLGSKLADDAKLKLKGSYTEVQALKAQLSHQKEETDSQRRRAEGLISDSRNAREAASQLKEDRGRLVLEMTALRERVREIEEERLRLAQLQYSFDGSASGNGSHTHRSPDVLPVEGGSAALYGLNRNQRLLSAQGSSSNGINGLSENKSRQAQESRSVAAGAAAIELYLSALHEGIMNTSDEALPPLMLPQLRKLGDEISSERARHVEARSKLLDHLWGQDPAHDSNTPYSMNVGHHSHDAKTFQKYRMLQQGGGEYKELRGQRGSSATSTATGLRAKPAVPTFNTVQRNTKNEKHENHQYQYHRGSSAFASATAIGTNGGVGVRGMDTVQTLAKLRERKRAYVRALAAGKDSAHWQLLEEVY